MSHSDPGARLNHICHQSQQSADPRALNDGLGCDLVELRSLRERLVEKKMEESMAKVSPINT